MNRVLVSARRALTEVKGGGVGRLDAAQCEPREKIVSFLKQAKPEVIMAELSEQSAALVEQSVADTATRLTKANKNALDFLMGAQKVMLEEIVFAGNEMLERTRTETHLLSEFVSKMAGSHSVGDLKTMYEECGRHQIDFIRRDNDRLFKHGERMIETTTKLFSKSPQN
jgi:hypothetical protein